MCLDITKTNTKRVERTLKKSPSHTAIFYKIYFLTKPYLQPVYFNEKNSIREPGYVISNRKDKELSNYEIETSIIDYGIHVFDTKLAAKMELNFVEYHYSNQDDGVYVIVPVVCSLKDFVAAGIFSGNSRRSSVFMRIKITKQSWNKVMKEQK